MNRSVGSILHPTDFSDLSGLAFAHALRIAVAAKSKLQILHVTQHDTVGALAFPHVRRLLVQWKLSEEDDPPWVVATKLGIEVHNVRLKCQEPTQGITGFLHAQPCDLWCLPPTQRVALSIGRGGRWRKQYSEARLSWRCSSRPVHSALSVKSVVTSGSGARSFSVDFSPEPRKAIETIQLIGRLLTGGTSPCTCFMFGAQRHLAFPLSNLASLPPVVLRSGMS